MITRILAPVLFLSVASILPALAQETPQSWFDEGRAAVERNAALRAQSQGRARNIILFVGDGMGVSTVTAARILEGQLRGETGEENVLSFETFPNVALAKTYNTDSQVADSAGTMSAMVTGVKTRIGAISVNQFADRRDCRTMDGNRLLTILERAEMRGLATGVVSTARLTHATPAANYAHSVDRNYESDADADIMRNGGECPDIASQLIDFSDNVFGSDGLEVAIGGGRSNFLSENMTDPEYGGNGRRRDGRDLTREWLERHPASAYVWNQAQFDAVDAATTDHLLGLFEPSHMQYEADREEGGHGEPSLSEMTAKAIEILSRNENGYYLNVEAGRIDHAHHAVNPRRALMDTIALSDAVRTAMAIVDLSETLIIVTADHSHVFTIAGYPGRGNPILGTVANAGGTSQAQDGMPYTTLGYHNGPAPRFDDEEYTGRANPGAVDTQHVDYQADTLVPLSSETHGGEDVAIYAIGAGADLVRGVMEQNAIFHVMLEASQLEQR
ncbi:MAG: alkaline phosphatase [Pseudohongiellaceae bacterium]